MPKPPCISADEKIYLPGMDGVKPPRLQTRKPAAGEKNEPLPRAAFELIVNKEGRICSIKVLSAPDEAKGREAAAFIADHWAFLPATRKGEPVAVTMQVNFNQTGR